MGKLVKNHWARLIILVAAGYQVAASISGFFWPKVFFDFLTTNLDPVVRPIPILQIINLVLGLFGLCLELPLPLFTSAAKRYAKSNSQCKTTMEASNGVAVGAPQQVGVFTKALAMFHGSIEARLFIYPLSSLVAFLLYQGTNAGFYYIIGMGVYFWAFSEGEVIMGAPWTLPRKTGRSGALSKV